MQGEEWREGGAHRAATKSLRQLRSAGFTGDDEDCRRQRRKGVEESGHYRASQLPMRVEDDGAEDGAPSSHQHDRGGSRGPRDRRRATAKCSGKEREERRAREGESGGDRERRRWEWGADEARRLGLIPSARAAGWRGGRAATARARASVG